MIDIDTSTEFGRRVDRRLREEHIIWLTTVDSQGTPQPRPVWFWWDGDTVLIYTVPGTYKLQHLERSPKAALNLNSDEHGGDVVVITGEARVAEDTPPATGVPEYAEKYAQGMAELGMSVEQFAERFSVPIRVTPMNLRGQ